MKKKVLVFLFAVSGVGISFPFWRHEFSEWFGIANHNMKRLPTETIIRPEMELVGGETEFLRRRREWIEQMHRAAPGTDYKEMDRQYLEEQYKQYLFSGEYLKSGNGLDTVANGLLIGKWKEKGANNVAGRVTAVFLDTIGQKLYIGSDGRNIWRANPDGSNWEVLNDKLPFNGISLIKIIPHNGGRRILVGTGTNIFYFSDNLGLTWQTGNGLAAISSSSIERVIVANDSIKSIYILGRLFSSPNRTFIYKSVDHGNNFTRIALWTDAQFGETRSYDLWTSGIGYAGVFLLRNNQILKLTESTNTFESFSTIPLTDEGYGVLAGFWNGTILRLWALVEKQIYVSDDQGFNFISTYQFPNYPFFKTSFSASLTNPDQVFFGDIECFHSMDGSADFEKVNNWWEYYGDVENKLHADIPVVYSCITNGGSELHFVATDGGIYSSEANFETFTNVSMEGLHNSQYYSVYSHKTDTNFIFLGSQDQGFQRCNVDSGTNLGFKQVVSGDYGHIVSGNNGNSIWMVYPGFIDYYADARQQTNSINWDFTSGSTNFWMPPLMAKPGSANVCYMAGGSLSGGNQSRILKCVAQNNQIVVSQLAFDFKATTASNGGNISAMAISPLDSNRWYVLTDNGKFFYTTNGGSTWTKTNNFSGSQAHYFYGACILPSASNPDLVYISGSGYSNPPVFKSTNNGFSFSAMRLGLPSTMVYKIVSTPDDRFLFAATEVGPFVYARETNQWYDMKGRNAPAQNYWSLEYISDRKIVRFVTYGRGTWDFRISEILTGNRDIEVEKAIGIYPNPARNEVEISGFEGTAQIISTTGKTNHSERVGKGQKLNVSKLPRGVYMLRLHSDKGKKETRKLVLE